MKRSKQASITPWAVSATVGVLSAVVMIAAAAQEAPAEATQEAQECKVVEWCTCEERVKPRLLDVESVEENTGHQANMIENVNVTFYCCEKRKHICGTGDGITATGTEVTPWYSVAVDPKVIPLGSTIYVDFGDGVIHQFRAEDTGGAVKGNHIDIAVAGHQEALELGIKTATVYWIKE